IERFAPGFQDCILARHVLPPAELQKRDSNLVGGDISGAIADLREFVFRPSWRGYGTSAANVYICSASTPPGGGVHGMCGYPAAQAALRAVFGRAPVAMGGHGAGCSRRARALLDGGRRGDDGGPERGALVALDLGGAAACPRGRARRS